MAAKVCAFTVVLRDDITQEDAELVSRMLMLIKGVAEVTPVNTNMEHYVAKAQARRELERKLLKVLHPQLSDLIEGQDG